MAATDSAGNGHLTVQQIARIVCSELTDLGLPALSEEERDHAIDCDACALQVGRLCDAVTNATDHEQHRLVVTFLPADVLSHICQQVIQEFESNEGGIEGD